MSAQSLLSFNQVSCTEIRALLLFQIFMTRLTNPLGRLRRGLDSYCLLRSWETLLAPFLKISYLIGSLGTGQQTLSVGFAEPWVANHLCEVEQYFVLLFVENP
jgi:hypothetical protein